jgi:hypothetical protein
MQEDLTNTTIAAGEKVISVGVNATKFTAETLLKLLQALLGVNKNKTETVQQVDGSDVKVKVGRQSMKNLLKQGDEVSASEVSKTGLGTFKNTARKYGVSYSLLKNNSVDPPRWTVFFKAKDAEVMNSAFREYTAKMMSKKKGQEVAPQEQNKDDLEQGKDVAPQKKEQGKDAVEREKDVATQEKEQGRGGAEKKEKPPEQKKEQGKDAANRDTRDKNQPGKQKKKSSPEKNQAKQREKEGVMKNLEKARAKRKEMDKAKGQEKNLKKSDRSR